MNANKNMNACIKQLLLCIFQSKKLSTRMHVSRNAFNKQCKMCLICVICGCKIDVTLLNKHKFMQAMVPLCWFILALLIRCSSLIF